MRWTCSDDRQARALALMHHAVVKVKWTLALSEPSSPDGVKGNLHDARSEQEYMEGEMVMKIDGAGQVKEDGDGEF